MKSSIGQYALFQMASSGMRYPAKIVSRDGRWGKLVWRDGNVYIPGDSPTSSTFSRWARECTEALEDANMIAATKSRVCSVPITKP